MKGEMYHIGVKYLSIDAAGVDIQVSDYYILLIITSELALILLL